MKSHAFYRLYGLEVHSDFPLLASKISRVCPEVQILSVSRSFFQNILKSRVLPAGKISYRTLSDGSHVIGFFDLFLFWVSADGKLIKACRLKPSRFKKGFEPALIFLQTNVLSFSLLKMGYETQHSSCVVYQGKALAFMGETQYGKSTLATALLQKNCHLLTDDLLALKFKGNGVQAYSGIPIVKLWPDAQRLLLDSKKTKSGIRMHPKAQKHVFQTDIRQQALMNTAPLRLIYVLWPRLAPKSREVWIRPLKFQDAVISLIKSSHNLIVDDQGRLQSQLDFFHRLARKIPVYGLSFPKDRKRIFEVRDALFRHAMKRLAVKK